MNSRFSTAALVARRQDASIADTVVHVCDELRALGAHIIMEDQTAHFLGERVAADQVMPRSELGQHSDIVVVIGGDGSLLGVSRAVGQSGVPIVGVNRGGLGFLAGVSPEHVRRDFTAIWHGDFALEDHFLLHAEVRRERQVVQVSNALNDVVVHSGSMARMIEFDLWVNDEFVYDQRSDGVIVASPTGSTAYALSAGGPIMHPGLDAIAIVPMFPHTLTSRPLVLPGNAKLKVVVTHSKDKIAQVSCDSQVNAGLSVGDEVHVSKSPDPLHLLYPPGHSFYQSCRSKLDWASRLGGRSTED